MQPIATISLYFTLALFSCSCSALQLKHVKAEGIQPGCARTELTAGNKRFVDGGMDSHAWQQERVVHTGEFGQSPSVGVLSCSDSRVPVEIIFDMGVGDLFVSRSAGGIDNAEATATFEYGFKALGMNSILVLGHTKCGAVQATLDGTPLPGTMSVLSAAIYPAIAELMKNPTKMSASELAIAAEEANTRWQMAQILKRSAILREAVTKGELTMLCAIYDVNSGSVRFLD